MYFNFINKSPLYTLYTQYGCDRFTLKIQNPISHIPFIYIYISVMWLSRILIGYRHREYV